jgi:N utilization substance protein B
MAKQSLNEIEAQFRVDNDFSDVDGAYFREIRTGFRSSRPKSTRPRLAWTLTIEELDPG